MSSSNASRTGRQKPRVHVAPRADRTYGDLAADLAADYGLAPDPWQRLVLDDWLADKGGKWSALTCGLAVPRQNGKNALLEVRELFGAVGRGEKILHTAHEVKTAQKHFRRLKHFFGNRANDPGAKYPELNALVDTIRSVNGQEAVLLKNGGAIEIVARSKNSGRGFTVDVLVMDEAQELGEDALEALMPTTSAAPLGNPQWIFTGTPPGPSASGEVFTRVRREALGDKPGAMCWHEWSIESRAINDNLDDRALWYNTNPALGSRLQLDVVAGERARFSDDGFARERLGQWASDADGAAIIQADVWDGLKGSPPVDARISYGVKFAVDGSSVSLAGARRPDAGPVFVEVIESRSMAHGVTWLADWLAERWRDTAAITIDGKGGSLALVAALRERGVRASVIITPTSDQAIAAYAGLLDAATYGNVSHAGQPGLAASVASAGRRDIGVSGGWGFKPITQDGDVTPIEAVALALYGAKTSKRRPGRKAEVDF